MTSNTKPLHYPLALAVLAGLLAGHTAPALASTTYSDPPGDNQCAMADINDSLHAVGSCSTANGTGLIQAAYGASLGGALTLLTPLVVGQDCEAGGIPNNGVIMGNCTDGANHTFGVKWASTAVAPLPLQPLSALQTGLLADVSTGASGYNHNGFVIGVSESGSGTDTPVITPTTAILQPR